MRISLQSSVSKRSTQTQQHQKQVEFHFTPEIALTVELTRFCAKNTPLDWTVMTITSVSICNYLGGRRLMAPNVDGVRVRAARSRQPCQENCTTSAQTYFLKKFWSNPKSVIVIPWLLDMCDDDVLQSFSLTSCVSAADVFIVCVDACVALVSVNLAEFFSGSDTGNTAGQMDPLLTVLKKAQLRIVALLKQTA